MKKLATILPCSFVFFFLMNFIYPDPTNNINDTKNSIVVSVKTSSGSAKRAVKVVGEVCGGISCIGQTDAVYTDSNGYATITFSSGCKLCEIYLDGKSNEGTYRDGEEYGFVR